MLIELFFHVFFCKLGHPAKEYSHEAIGLVTGRELAPVTSLIALPR